MKSQLNMDDLRKLQGILNDPGFFEIVKWPSVPLADFHILDRNAKGLYALANSEFGIVYIGKGNPIFNRLKSHFRATEGKDNAECWDQFFTNNRFKSGLKAYYYQVDCTDDTVVSEKYREVLERVLQIKYDPLFDRLYPKRNHRRIENFEDKVSSFRTI
jgi:hypothetical protein